MEEIEVKYYIEPKEIEKKLEGIGAKKIFDRVFERKVFDYPDLRLDQQGAWIRVRDEGEKITMSFKQRLGVKSHDGSTNDESMEEIEFDVPDFKKACLFLERIGLKEKFHQQNRRVCYKLGDLEYDIEYWPMIPPYIEIEAPTWDRVEKAIELLGLDPKDKKIYSNYQMYKERGIDILDYSEITFEKQIKKK